MNHDFHFNWFEKIQRIREMNRFLRVLCRLISEGEDGLVGIVNAGWDGGFYEDGDLRDRDGESISIRAVRESLSERCCVHFEGEMAETEDEEIADLISTVVYV